MDEFQQSWEPITFAACASTSKLQLTEVCKAPNFLETDVFLGRWGIQRRSASNKFIGFVDRLIVSYRLLAHTVKQLFLNKRLRLDLCSSSRLLCDSPSLDSYMLNQ